MMKKVVFIALIIIVGSSAFAQGINFQQLSYENALAKAKEESKLVFIDCVTDWCRPCKEMAKKIFPQEQVGEYFNEHFVSVKMDMEKGEGIELGTYYDVNAFPTLLFLDAEGEELNRHIGMLNANALIDKAKVSIDKGINDN